MAHRKKNCCVVVLGDLGRSPRMQYHIQSLLEHNFHVDILSYVESEPLDTIRNNPNAMIYPLRKFPEIKMPNILKYILKIIWQAITLLVTLCSISRPKCLLLQNPPAIPAVLVCFAYCKISRAKFVIDWHNYTYSILALNSKKNSLVVRVSKWLEHFFGQRADANFCVTKAMKNDLNKNWGIEATVLYDRPPLQFQPINLERKHDLFMKLSKTYSQFTLNEEIPGALEKTEFTLKMMDGSIFYRKDRSAILISSTSWTPDEDFSILLDALEEYERVTKENTNYPKLLCVITGKGPQKNFYTELIAKKSWKMVSFLTPWLSAEDYSLLLAAADLGVCLHWSSSGLDLPMKVVDMFGVGLVVCAKNFNCLHELIQNGNNGLVFDSSNELTSQILMWFESFPNNSNIISMKKGFEEKLNQFQRVRWKQNWSMIARPLLTTDR